MENNKKHVNLNVTSPVIPCDGNAIGINPDGTLNLLFFQINNENNDSVDANSVSIMRLTREQLENLSQSIQDVLKQTGEKAAKASQKK